jgi:hypothetical protein
MMSATRRLPILNGRHSIRFFNKKAIANLLDAEKIAVQDFFLGPATN